MTLRRTVVVLSERVFSRQRLCAVLATLCLSAGGVACPRPPVTLPPDDTVALGEIDLPTYLQDRPAIGGKWYDYTVDGHLLEPKDEAWIVDDGDGGHHGFTIVSAYDDDTGDTGIFTLDVVHREGAAWSAPETFVTTTNIKDGAPTCLALAALQEMACSEVGWDLRFVLQSRLSVFAGFAVAEPAVFFAADVRVARQDGVALADLADPATLAALDDGDADYQSTEWNYGAFAKDLPLRGRALGALSRVGGQSWSVVDGGRGLVEFSLAPVDATTLRFRLRRQPIDIEDFTAPEDLGEFREVDVDITTLPVFLSFSQDNLLSLPEKLASSLWPQQPPFARDYDIVIDGGDGDEPTLLLSPASAVKHLGAAP